MLEPRLKETKVYGEIGSGRLSAPGRAGSLVWIFRRYLYVAYVRTWSRRAEFTPLAGVGPMILARAV